MVFLKLGELLFLSTAADKTTDEYDEHDAME
jgi:hypothetical protein